MFVRKLKHPNGVTYVQVIEKTKGKSYVKKSFGSCHTEQELTDMVSVAHQWIKSQQGINEMDFDNERLVYNNLLKAITSHKLVGIEVVLGRIFDAIGFNQIKDELFRSLVLYRLVYPKSKLKTTEYLYRYEGKSYSEDEIYRYMDKLHNSQKELIQNISYAHTKKVLSEAIKVVFYDVTTIYFEIEQEDELRKQAFPKRASIKTHKLYSAYW